MATIRPLPTRLVTVLAGLALGAASGIALGEEPLSRSQDHGDDAPRLYFSENACASASNCPIPPNAETGSGDYTTLVTLTLPPGDYFLTSKLVAFPSNAIVNNGFGYFNFECALIDLAGNQPLDYSSFDGLFTAGLVLQVPVSFHRRGGGTVRVACRVAGAGGDGSPIDMRVKNANLAAIPVTPARARHQ